MSAPTPAAPWQEITTGQDTTTDAELLTWTSTIDGTVRRWVLPAAHQLATAPGTVIEIPSGTRAGTWTLGTLGWTLTGDPTIVSGTDLTPDAIGYSIIAQPPAVTATAVLTDVRAAPNGQSIDLDPIAQQYGATMPTAPSPL
jgi:hypothetical protein